MQQLGDLTLENSLLESRIEKLDSAHRERIARLEEELFQAKQAPARAAAPLPLSNSRSSGDVARLISLQFEKDAAIDALKKRQEELVEMLPHQSSTLPRCSGSWITAQQPLIPVIFPAKLKRWLQSVQPKPALSKMLRLVLPNHVMRRRLAS